MASPITTTGFSVQERLNPVMADPRLFGRGYDAVFPAFNQGLGAAGALSQLVEDAQMRPVRRQLAQIQLEDASARRRLLPLQIAEMERELAIPKVINGDVAIEDLTRVYPAALDEAGNRTGEPDREVGDLVQVQQVREFGPGGIETPRTIRKILKTAEQRMAEEAANAARIRASDALAGQRARGPSYESTTLIGLIDDAEANGDTEAANLYRKRLERLNTMPGILAPGTTYTRTVEQQAARAGLTLAAAQELVKTAEGAEALAQMAIANENKKRSILPVEVSGEQAALIKDAGKPKASLPKGPVAIPQGAINMLIQNPELADQFDEKYGQGSAASILSPRG